MERKSNPLSELGDHREQRPEKGSCGISRGRFPLQRPGFGGPLPTMGVWLIKLRNVFLNSIIPSVEMVSLMLRESIIPSL